MTLSQSPVSLLTLTTSLTRNLYLPPLLYHRTRQKRQFWTPTISVSHLFSNRINLCDFDFFLLSVPVYDFSAGNFSIPRDFTNVRKKYVNVGGELRVQGSAPYLFACYVTKYNQQGKLFFNFNYSFAGSLIAKGREPKKVRE